MKGEFCLDLLMHHKVHISWKNDLSFPSSHHKDFHFRLTRQDFSKLMNEMKKQTKRCLHFDSFEPGQ